MFKRFAAIGFVALLLMMCVLPTFCVSARTATVDFTISANDAEVGETMNVVVSVSAESYFTNATLYLHYNPEAVKFVVEDVGSVSPSGATMFGANDFTDQGYVKGAYVTAKIVKKGGELLLFEFEVLKDIPAEFSLTFDECQGEDENGNIFDVEYVTHGCVANNDGTVTTGVPATRPTGTAATTAPPDGGNANVTADPSAPTVPTAADPSENQGSTASTDTATTVTNEQGEVISTPATSAQMPVGSSQEAGNDEGDAQSSNGIDPAWIIVAVVAVALIGTGIAFVLLKKKKES